MPSLTSYKSRFRAATVILLLASALLVGLAPQVRADKSHLVSVESAKHTPSRLIELTKGMSQVVPVAGPVADIMVANPAVIDVTALQSDRLYIVGLTYGTTNVTVLDASGNVISTIDVHVKIDLVALQAMIHQLFPHEDVKVSSLYSQIVLTGFVSTPDMANQISDFVEHAVTNMESNGTGASKVERDTMIVNMLKVAGEQQVMLKVKIVEASRETLRELGIEFNNGSAVGSPSGADTKAGVTTAAASGLAQIPLGVGSVLFNRGSHGVFGEMQVIIRALEENGLINTLAEPNLTAISGEQAGFLAGGEFPIPMSRDQNNNVVITYKQFGVALNFKPTVLSDDRISLQLQTEVSTVSNQNSLTSNGIVIPGFNVRRAATTVELGSGGSLMMAGLLQSNVTDSLRQLPGIRDVPILGQLMSSRSFQRNESELLVIVTAYLVKPYANSSDLAQKQPLPEVSPLAHAFEDNIRHAYTKAALEPELFKGDGGYGYLVK